MPIEKKLDAIMFTMVLISGLIAEETTADTTYNNAGNDGCL